MTHSNSTPFQQHPGAISRLVDTVNEALSTYSDKDWNYSRISLITKPLEELKSPYVLWIEVLDLTEKQKLTELKSLADEVKWGERHSSELGILEVVSLRINKALFEVTSNDHWQGKRPVLRIMKKESLADQGIPCALWYEVIEVVGDDFDNR